MYTVFAHVNVNRLYAIYQSVYNSTVFCLGYLKKNVYFGLLFYFTLLSYSILDPSNWFICDKTRTYCGCYHELANSNISNQWQNCLSISVQALCFAPSMLLDLYRHNSLPSWGNWYLDLFNNMLLYKSNINYIYWHLREVELAHPHSQSLDIVFPSVSRIIIFHEGYSQLSLVVILIKSVHW